MLDESYPSAGPQPTTLARTWAASPPSSCSTAAAGAPTATSPCAPTRCSSCPRWPGAASQNPAPARPGPSAVTLRRLHQKKESFIRWRWSATPLVSTTSGTRQHTLGISGKEW